MQHFYVIHWRVVHQHTPIYTGEWCIITRQCMNACTHTIRSMHSPLPPMKESKQTNLCIYLVLMYSNAFICFTHINHRCCSNALKQQMSLCVAMHSFGCIHWTDYCDAVGRPMKTHLKMTISRSTPRVRLLLAWFDKHMLNYTQHEIATLTPRGFFFTNIRWMPSHVWEEKTHSVAVMKVNAISNANVRACVRCLLNGDVGVCHAGEIIIKGCKAD